jgi:hypothetical protein
VSTRSSLERWIESYVGGWQILLPNGGDECIVDGVTWPFHGEAAMIPWEVLNRSSTSATFETRLIGVPLHVRRTFEIEGRVLRLHETVTNESRDSMEVMWSHHPAFGAPFIDETCVISAGCSTILADELAPGSLLEMGSRHPWPLARDTEGREINFSRVPGPDAPSSVLAYLTDFESGYFAITNATLKLGVGMRWPTDIFDKAWLWQEIHSSTGWPWYRRAYVIAIEPASTIPGHGMVNARSMGHRGIEIAGGSSRDVLIEVVVFDGAGEIAGIDAGGVVKWSTP